MKYPDWINPFTLTKLRDKNFNPIAVFDLPTFHPNMPSDLLQRCFDSSISEVERMACPHIFHEGKWLESVRKQCPTELLGIVKHGPYHVGFNQNFMATFINGVLKY